MLCTMEYKMKFLNLAFFILTSLMEICKLIYCTNSEQTVLKLNTKL